MKKFILTLLAIILTLIIALVVVFVFNPFDLRTKLVGAVVNSYLSSTSNSETSPAEDADTSASVEAANRNPLLNEEQAKVLEELGVDVSRLPSSVSPAMEACFVEKLGKERTQAIVAGDSPTAMEVLKSRNCLDK